MPSKAIIFFLFLFVHTTMDAQPPVRVQQYVIDQVNKVRAKGCKCGNKQMKPARALVWSNKLYETAASHAREMDYYNYFGHISKDGLDVGDRFDRLGYKWQYAGENLGEGQKDFNEVLEDWIESPSHCKMLMHPDMKQMGLAKRGKYWVQHFGAPMPKNHYRTKRSYSEGN